MVYPLGPHNLTAAGATGRSWQPSFSPANIEEFLHKLYGYPAHMQTGPVPCWWTILVTNRRNDNEKLLGQFYQFLARDCKAHRPQSTVFSQWPPNTVLVNHTLDFLTRHYEPVAPNFQDEDYTWLDVGTYPLIGPIPGRSIGDDTEAALGTPYDKTPVWLTHTAFETIPETAPVSVANLVMHSTAAPTVQTAEIPVTEPVVLSAPTQVSTVGTAAAPITLELDAETAANTVYSAALAPDSPGQSTQQLLLLGQLRADFMAKYGVANYIKYRQQSTPAPSTILPPVSTSFLYPPTVITAAPVEGVSCMNTMEVNTSVANPTAVVTTAVTPRTSLRDELALAPAEPAPWSTVMQQDTEVKRRWMAAWKNRFDLLSMENYPLRYRQAAIQARLCGAELKQYELFLKEHPFASVPDITQWWEHTVFPDSLFAQRQLAKLTSLVFDWKEPDASFNAITALRAEIGVLDVGLQASVELYIWPALNRMPTYAAFPSHLRTQLSNIASVLRSTTPEASWGPQVIHKENPEKLPYGIFKDLVLSVCSNHLRSQQERFQKHGRDGSDNNTNQTSNKKAKHTTNSESTTGLSPAPQFYHRNFTRGRGNGRSNWGGRGRSYGGRGNNSTHHNTERHSNYVSDPPALPPVQPYNNQMNAQAQPSQNEPSQGRGGGGGGCRGRGDGGGGYRGDRGRTGYHNRGGGGSRGGRQDWYDSALPAAYAPACPEPELVESASPAAFQHQVSPVHHKCVPAPSLVQKLQHLTGQFTYHAFVPAACEPICAEHSSTLEQYCSGALIGKHSLVHAPVTHLTTALKHFKLCQKLAPLKTSAVFIIPKKAVQLLAKMLSGMHKLLEISPLQKVFVQQKNKAEQQLPSATKPYADIISAIPEGADDLLSQPYKIMSTVAWVRLYVFTMQQLQHCLPYAIVPQTDWP